ncbi:MAG: helix-turn-helix transcriptional regulator [Treponema sp.]|nr:helix-turn-helix transcriptional regulator [Treponema sp.]
MDFRTRLREQIEYLGLLDKEVAKQAGITKHAMDTYVGSRGCMPAADIAVRLAKVLGVSVEWLVEGNPAKDGAAPDSDMHTLIHYFSTLSPHDKKLLLEIAKTMHTMDDL